MHRGNWVAPGGMSVTLLYGVTLMVKTQEKGSPCVHMGLVWAGAGHSFCSCVSQPAVPGVPGTEVVTSRHPTGVRVLSGFNQQKTDEHVHLSCPTDSFFSSNWLSNTESHPLWVLFYDFIFNAENTDLSNRSFSRLRPMSLEFTVALQEIWCFYAVPAFSSDSWVLCSV